MALRGILNRKATARLLQFSVQCAIGIFAVALLTWSAFSLRLNLSTTELLYFLTVVLVALHFGFWQGTVVSVVAVLCQDYFFVPPLYTLYVNDPRNYVTLVVFEFSVLVVSRLSAREQAHARAAEERRSSLERLYELSRRTLSLDLRQPPGPQLLLLVKEIFELEAVAIFDADLDTIDTYGELPVDSREMAPITCYFEIDQDDPDSCLSRRVLHLGTTPIGALLVRGELDPLTVDAMASTVSITFDRYRSLASETKAEAARRSEQLRSTVLDQLGHAFKTPLTAIRMASSGLLELGHMASPHTELAALIDEQAILLNDLATRLLQTARLEAEEVSLQRQEIAIADLIEEVAAERSGKLGDHSLQVSISNKSLGTRGDRELLASIVGQFVDNAVKYSYPGSRIEISAEESATEVLIAVHNEGPPIRQEDRERIFERYYRCAETRHQVPGTGIGLSIARKAAEAHHGHVWVISNQEEGTTFFLSVFSSKEEVVDHCHL
jgi:two-component system sensor histidine kinase KdpD